VKKSYRYTLFLLLFILTLIVGVRAFRYPAEKTVSLPVTEGAQVSILKDQTLGNIEEILEIAKEPDRFTAYNPNTSRTSSDIFVSCWIQLPLSNQQNTALERILEIDYRWVDIAQLYEIHPDGSYTMYQNGENTPSSQKKLPFATHAFQIRFEPNESKTYFLYLRDYHWILPAITMWESPAAYIERAHTEQNVVFLYMGLLLGLILMNGCVYLALRDQDTLYYILFLLAASALHIVHFNLHTAFLNKIEMGKLSWLPAGVNFFLYSGLLILTAGLFLRFALEFLQTEHYCQRAYRPVLYLANGLILVSPIFMFGPATLFGRSIISVIVTIWACSHLIALSLALYSVFKKVPQTYFFIPATILLLIVSWQYTKVLMTGGIPTSELLLQWLYASSIEMIVLAIGLSERIRMVNEQKEAAQAHALSEAEKRAELQQQYNSQLECEVAARTSELAASDQQKSELLRIIAHDIKAPIDGVSSLARMLADMPENIKPALIKEYTKDIEGSAAHLSELTKSLLLWGQLQAGQHSIGLQPYLLSDLQEAITPSLKTLAKTKAIQLEWQIPPQTFARFDFESIASVLRNLIINAIKYSHPQSRIRISAHSESERVQISVQDWGIGITAERLQHLREQQSLESTKGVSGEPGTGIGLQICYDILKTHNSNLHITSKAGVGTHCHFYLLAWNQNSK
jgi:signal transduction histidine kinase